MSYEQRDRQEIEDEMVVKLYGEEFRGGGMNMLHEGISGLQLDDIKPLRSRVMTMHEAAEVLRYQERVMISKIPDWWQQLISSTMEQCGFAILSLLGTARRLVLVLVLWGGEILAGIAEKFAGFFGIPVGRSWKSWFGKAGPKKFIRPFYDALVFRRLSGQIDTAMHDALHFLRARALPQGGAKRGGYGEIEPTVKNPPQVRKRKRVAHRG